MERALAVTALVCALAAAGRAEPADCGLAKQRGACTEFAVRWYYDTEYGGCLRFWYGGCGGNGNRFQSEAECAGQCVSPAGDELCHLPAVRGACKRAKPRWFSDPDSGACRRFTYSGCLGNDNRFESEAACQARCGAALSGGRRPAPPPGPQPGPPPGPAACLLPDRVAGSCRQYVIRYSFVAARQQCAPFYYGGCDGNANNFETSEACMSACQSPLPLSPRLGYRRYDVPSYQPTEAPYRQPTEAPYRQPTEAPYQEPTEGHYQPTEAPSYEQTESPDTGDTESPYRYYSITPATLEPDMDVCLLPAEGGRCRAYLPSYYYNADRQRCESFIYGGCGGNANRFQTREACEQRCQEAEPSTAAPTPAIDLCQLPPQQGNCRAHIPQFYFNAALRRCFTFVYGGCGGNANRFATAEECAQRCQPDYVPTEPPAVTEDRAAHGYDDGEHDAPVTTDFVDYGDYEDYALAVLPAAATEAPGVEATTYDYSDYYYPAADYATADYY